MKKLPEGSPFSNKKKEESLVNLTTQVSNLNSSLAEKATKAELDNKKIISSLDFGLKGDGTDNITDIKTFLQSSKNTKILYEGTYNISEIVNLSDCTLIGVGNVVFKRTSALATGNAIRFNNCNVENIKFDGNLQATGIDIPNIATKSGTCLSNGGTNRFTKCTFVNSNGSHFGYPSYGDLILVDCFFGSCADHVVYTGAWIDHITKVKYGNTGVYMNNCKTIEDETTSLFTSSYDFSGRSLIKTRGSFAKKIIIENCKLGIPYHTMLVTDSWYDSTDNGRETVDTPDIIFKSCELTSYNTLASLTGEQQTEGNNTFKTGKVRFIDCDIKSYNGEVLRVYVGQSTGSKSYFYNDINVDFVNCDFDSMFRVYCYMSCPFVHNLNHVNSKIKIWNTNASHNYNSVNFFVHGTSKCNVVIDTCDLSHNSRIIESNNASVYNGNLNVLYKNNKLRSVSVIVNDIDNRFSLQGATYNLVDNVLFGTPDKPTIAITETDSATSVTRLNLVGNKMMKDDITPSLLNTTANLTISRATYSKMSVM